MQKQRKIPPAIRSLTTEQEHSVSSLCIAGPLRAVFFTQIWCREWSSLGTKELNANSVTRAHLQLNLLTRMTFRFAVFLPLHPSWSSRSANSFTFILWVISFMRACLSLGLILPGFFPSLQALADARLYACLQQQDACALPLLDVGICHN